MEIIKALATGSRIVKDSQGTGIEFTFKNAKVCNEALSAAYAEKLNVSGGTPTTFYIWH